MQIFLQKWPYLMFFLSYTAINHVLMNMGIRFLDRSFINIVLPDGRSFSLLAKRKRTKRKGNQPIVASRFPTFLSKIGRCGTRLRLKQSSLNGSQLLLLSSAISSYGILNRPKLVMRFQVNLHLICLKLCCSSFLLQ